MGARGGEAKYKPRSSTLLTLSAAYSSSFNSNRNETYGETARPRAHTHTRESSDHGAPRSSLPVQACTRLIPRLMRIPKQTLPLLTYAATLPEGTQFKLTQRRSPSKGGGWVTAQSPYTCAGEAEQKGGAPTFLSATKFGQALHARGGFGGASRVHLPGCLPCLFQLGSAVGGCGGVSLSLPSSPLSRSTALAEQPLPAPCTAAQKLCASRRLWGNEQRAWRRVLAVAGGGTASGTGRRLVSPGSGGLNS